MRPAPFVRRIRLRNYKSLALCAAELGPLTLLVGRNGSGKSNFVDSIRFVADALNQSLEQAIKGRGGIDVVRRGSTGHPHNFAIDLDVQLSREDSATYGFEIASLPSGGYRVKHERLSIHYSTQNAVAGYRIVDGTLHLMTSSGQGAIGGNSESLNQSMPPVLPDRLYLVYAAGFPAIRKVFDGLRSMAFYHFDPTAMKSFQPTDAGEVLRADGSNIASVLARMQEFGPDVASRIQGYLSTVVPDITGVSVAQSNGHSALRFAQLVSGSISPWNFPAILMSNGTMSAFGALIAVNQFPLGANSPRLVAIEEPETALHPAATAALMDALREASTHTQIIVTTHSPDLLDRMDPDVEQLLVLQSVQGRTEIAPVDAASRDSIKTHLYSPGELLRMDQLQPDSLDLQRQLKLQFFAESEAVP